MMKSAGEILDELRALGETQRIEVKRGASIATAILETVCSFSNEPDLGGGYLLLGVEEDSENRLIPLYRVTGISEVDKLTNDLLSQCNSMFNVALRPSIEAETLEGKVVLKVWVPEVAPANKPIYFKAEGLPSGAFRRLATGDVRCTEDDLAIFYEGKGGATFDSSVLERASWKDLDDEVINEYRRERAKVSAEAFELGLPDAEMLEAISCVQKVEGEWKPTVAGVLLFGSKAALRRLFPMLRVDYIRVPAREWVRDPDRRFDTIDMRDPLMRVVRRALTAIQEDFAQPFSLPEGEVQREVTQALPARALREALVNAVMHRSYREGGPVQIIRYLNRVVIRNPGYSLKNEERLGESRSVNRNPTLAAVLYDTRFAETKGSGVRVMRGEMDRVGLTPPLFESRRDDNEFVVTFSTHHFLAAQDWEWLKAFRDFNLSEDESRALIWVREVGGIKGAIDNRVYRTLNGCDARESLRALRHLCDLELLELRSKGSTAFYIPGRALKERLGQVLPHTVSNGGFQGFEANSQGNEANSQDSEANSQDSEANSQDSEAYLEGRDALLKELSAPLQAQVLSLGTRTHPEKMQRVLFEICSFREWTTKELASLVGRHPIYLMESHLKPMAEKGQLQLKFPQQRNHPKQAYRSTTSVDLREK